jgi:hypothetical protein
MPTQTVGRLYRQGGAGECNGNDNQESIMVAYGRKGLSVFVFLATLAFAVAAVAEKPCLPEPLTWETWQALSSDMSLGPRETSQCRTLKHLVDAFARLDERDLPNSQSADVEKPEASGAELSVVAFVKTSAQVQRETCQLLAAIVRNIHDSATVLHALEVATLLEPSGSGCVGEVVAATPREVEGIAIVETAYDLCRSRNGVHCELLRNVLLK